MNAGINEYLILSGLIFSVGFFGILLRRNVLVMLMSLELMLNGVNLALVAFARFNTTSSHPMMDGPILVFFIITVAAAEVGLGLAIITALFRRRRSVHIHELNLLDSSQAD